MDDSLRNFGSPPKERFSVQNMFFCFKLFFNVSMIVITHLSGATALAYQFTSTIEPLVYTCLKHSCN